MLSTTNPARWDTDTPADMYGFKAMAFDPAFYATNSSLLPTAGRTHFTRLGLYVPSLITNLYVYVTTAGATLTANQNKAMLYDGAGNLLGTTVDQATAWQTTGFKPMGLVTPVWAAAGSVYVGFYHNGTTAPALGRTLVSIAPNNMNTTSPNLRTGLGAATGQTTTPAATLGAQTAASTLYWVAVA